MAKRKRQDQVAAGPGNGAAGAGSKVGDNATASTSATPTPPAPSAPPASQPERTRSASDGATLAKIKEAIDAGTYITRKHPHSRTGKQSPAWDVFHIVLNQETGAHIPATMCTLCRTVLYYDVENGTSSMLKHIKKYCPVSALSNKERIGISSIPQKFLDNFYDRLGELIAGKLCSPEIVTSVFMERVAQTLLDMAAAVPGRIYAKDIMPCSNTVWARLGWTSWQTRRGKTWSKRPKPL